MLQATICQAGTIDVTVDLNGKTIDRFRSDRGQVDHDRAIIAEVIKQMIIAAGEAMERGRVG
jgi:hypothetical protein